MDAIELHILELIKNKKSIPTPQEPEKNAICIGSLLSVKCLLWNLFLESGLTKQQLADQLETSHTEVRRRLDPKHATNLTSLDEVFRAFGHILVIGVEDDN